MGDKPAPAGAAFAILPGTASGLSPFAIALVSSNRSTGKACARKTSSAAMKRAPDDALDLLEAIVRSDQMVLSARMTAAATLAPYRHAKAGRFVERPLGIPESTCVADRKRAIAKLAAMARAKEISLDAANDLIAQESKFLEAEVGGDLEAQMAELKDTVARLAASNAASPNLVMVGGLPPLPGARVDLPVLAKPPDPADDSS
jgi:hypothetical protein